MFSPATRKASRLRHKDTKERDHGVSPSESSPLTPLPSELAGGQIMADSISNRPASGTPAPWATRPSVAVRIPDTTKNIEKGTEHDPTKPIYVADFPPVLRDVHEELLHDVTFGDKLFLGGMDKETGLCWMICASKIYIWSYFSSVLSKCVILEIPSSALDLNGRIRRPRHCNEWTVCIVKWGAFSAKNEKAFRQCNSAGVILCNMKSQAIVYWPDAFLECTPVVSFPTFTEVDESVSYAEGGGKDGDGHQETRLFENDHINSIIAAPVSSVLKECIAIACQSSGKLWHFHCTLTCIHREKIPHDVFDSAYTGNSKTNRRYARSLVWHMQPDVCSEKTDCQFFLLTNHEVQYWNAVLTGEFKVTKLSAHEIVGNDGDVGIKKDLAGQKRICLLDMQVDQRGKDISILVATFCKDRFGGSSYIQYSLLTMACKVGRSFKLEKKTPLQVIIPKAGLVENEDLLFSMRLRVGGKPPGSTIILSGDGTATVANYLRGCLRLYQFDLPHDAGKVLDASVFLSAEEEEEGAWVVLTEKVGVWAIPEKAVLLGGVEPPERSLSRKGSCNEGSTQEEKRVQAFGGNVAPRRASSEVWSSGDRPRTAVTGIAQRTAQDEETEALLGRAFCDFVISGEVEGAFERLKVKGAFEKEGETNVFVRTSKSIIDTLAKHWTTTRGTELVASTIVSSLLFEKQQKHQKLIQFLSLSRCHEELSVKQRHALLAIMEHGEKLASIIQLRELQNTITQSRSNDSHVSSSLWDLIQLVGDKSRRKDVMLMDRENAEVFYSKVSVIDEFFTCLSDHITYLIGNDLSHNAQRKRSYEIAKACAIIIQAAVQYRIEYQAWYPSPEGLLPWNCHQTIRSGLWFVLSSIMKLLKDLSFIDVSMKPELWLQLEILTDILLEAYVSSITVRIEQGEEHNRGLSEEYSRKRDELLDSLLEMTLKFSEAEYKDKCIGDEDIEAKVAIFREVSLPLLAIAKRHEGYSTLWHICYQLNDSQLLKKLMHDSCGPKGGFSNFVFNQLIKSHQYAKLLRLGEEFQIELARFLKDNNSLLWLHEIYSSQFSFASETLRALALSQDDDMAVDEEQDFVHIKLGSLSERRRLLNLSKIAAASDKKEGFEMKMLQIEADLHLLKLQEEVLSRLPDGDEKRNASTLLSPAVLVEMCLTGGTRMLALLAFEIFAWAGLSFRTSNRRFLEECWRNAASQDDWAALANSSTTEGWSDEVIVENLSVTTLFRASLRCYGPGGEAYEGNFSEVLPLRKDDADFLSAPGLSVEALLMQHKSFPDAGRLMLTAIVMGRDGVDLTAEADGELAMES